MTTEPTDAVELDPFIVIVGEFATEFGVRTETAMRMVGLMTTLSMGYDQDEAELAANGYVVAALKSATRTGHATWSSRGCARATHRPASSTPRRPAGAPTRPPRCAPSRASTPTSLMP